MPFQQAYKHSLIALPGPCQGGLNFVVVVIDVVFVVDVVVVYVVVDVVVVFVVVVVVVGIMPYISSASDCTLHNAFGNYQGHSACF